MPHNLLENSLELDQYLTTLGKEIKDLPVDERSAAQEELRQHLDAMIAAEEELGTGKTAAMEAALKRFGDAKQLGRQMRVESERKLVSASLRHVLGIFLVVFLLQEVVSWTIGREMGHIGGLLPMVVAGIATGIYAEWRRPGYAVTAGLMFVMAGGYLAPILLAGLVLDSSPSVPEWVNTFAYASLLFFSRFSVMAFLLTCGAYFAMGRREKRWDGLTTSQLNAVPRRLWALRYGIFTGR